MAVIMKEKGGNVVRDTLQSGTLYFVRGMI